MKIDFAYEKMGTKTRFDKEAWGNSEMAYWTSVSPITLHVSQLSHFACSTYDLLEDSRIDNVIMILFL